MTVAHTVYIKVFKIIVILYQHIEKKSFELKQSTDTFRSTEPIIIPVVDLCGTPEK